MVMLQLDQQLVLNQQRGWAHQSVERARRATRVAYLAVLALALIDGVWTLSGFPRTDLLVGTGWPLAALLALSGLWFERLQRTRIGVGRAPFASWPAGALAVLGLFSHVIFALLLAIGWFESWQLRSAYDLLPARD
ncbi:hypothetical protein BH10PSE17_BH10PSE17_33990 [soil metagenome]